MNDFDRWQSVLISRDLARVFVNLVTNPALLLLFMICAVCSSLTNGQSPTAVMSAQALANQATERLRGGEIPANYPQILKDYNRAIKLDHNLAQAYAGRGSLYWKRIHYLKSFHSSSVNQKVAEKFDLNPAQIPTLRRLALQDYKQAQLLYSQQGKILEAKQVGKAIFQAQRGDSFFCVPIKADRPWVCVNS